MAAVEIPTMKSQGAAKNAANNAAQAAGEVNEETAASVPAEETASVPMIEAVPKSKKLLKFTLDDGTGENRVILSGIHAFYEPEQLIGKTLIAIVNLPPRAMMGMESNGMLLSAIHTEEDEEKLNLLMVDPHIPAGAKLY